LAHPIRTCGRSRGAAVVLALEMGVVLQSLLIAIRPIDPIAFGNALLSLMAVLFAASGCRHAAPHCSIRCAPSGASKPVPVMQFQGSWGTAPTERLISM
jgi:hypothetical protein